MPVRIAILMIALVLAGQVDAAGQDKARKDACETVKAQIRYVQSRMRAGYTAKQGYRLEDRLRELRRKRSRLCR